MQEPPPVTITDPARPSAPRLSGEPDQVGQDADAPRPAGAASSRWGGVLLAGVLGFALSQLLTAGRDASPEVPPVDRPGLALVVGSQPVLNAQPGPDPATSAEVALVNTGPQPLRLTGAVVEELRLRWSAREVLRPGEQTSVLLREGDACARLAREPAGPRPRQELRVAVRPVADDLEDEVVLLLPVSFVRQYDDFTRSFCGLPQAARGLDVRPEPQALGDDEVLLPLGLVSGTVERLRLLDVASTVPGLTVELRDEAGDVVPLPLEIPGRYLVDLDIGLGPGVPEVDRYVVSVRVGGNACAILRHPEVPQRELVQLSWIAEDEPRRVVATRVGDVADAVRLGCP